MKRCGASLLVLVFLPRLAFSGHRLDSEKAMYVGGTVAAMQQDTEGTTSCTDEKVFVFEHPGGKFTIPYDRINDMEYGQKAARRLGLAIVLSPAALLSKKRKHYLTIGFLDQNEKQQVAVFELGKDIVRVTLASLEARTGRKIEYQDEEARKSGPGGQ